MGLSINTGLNQSACALKIRASSKLTRAHRLSPSVLHTLPTPPYTTAPPTALSVAVTAGSGLRSANHQAKKSPVRAGREEEEGKRGEDQPSCRPRLAGAAQGRSTVSMAVMSTRPKMKSSMSVTSRG